jgi:hypothetical protein
MYVMYHLFPNIMSQQEITVCRQGRKICSCSMTSLFDVDEWESANYVG